MHQWSLKKRKTKSYIYLSIYLSENTFLYIKNNKLKEGKKTEKEMVRFSKKKFKKMRRRW